MSTVQLQRDSYARASFMRQSNPNKHKRECKWCGTVMRTCYYYGWEDDGIYTRIRPSYQGPFCSVGCYRDWGGN